jgi:threonine/homoserine/homoserine lactone efflux protein
VPIDPGRLVALCAIALAIIAVPGPSVLFVVSRAVSLGRRAALATVAGNETGLLVQITAVAVGLGVVVQDSIVVFDVIKFAGAAYLVYLGVQAVRHRKKFSSALAGTLATKSLRRTYVEGIVVGVSNPKSFLLFAAILPQFVDPARGHVPLQMFVLGLLCVAIAFLSDGVWAVCAGTARAWFGGSKRRMEAIGGTAGVVMIGLGLNLALTGRSD